MHPMLNKCLKSLLRHRQIRSVRAERCFHHICAVVAFSNRSLPCVSTGNNRHVHPLSLSLRAHSLIHAANLTHKKSCTETSRSILTSASAGKIVVNGKDIVEVNRQNALTVLEKYDTILLDCDGVLWGTDHITHLPGIQSAMETLQRLGKKIFFVTNNSMHARSAYVRKFKEHGFDAPAEDVFCIAYASAVFLKTIMHITGSVYVIGNPGMTEELDIAGIANFGSGPDPDAVYQNIEDLRHIPLLKDVQAVLVGYDKYFNLNKAFKACSYMCNESCLFVATNDKEKSVLITPDRRQPLTGAIVDCVVSAAKRKPEVLGKPGTLLFRCIQVVHPGIDPARCLMIGDSVPVDIGFAKAVEMDSALVLSGVSSLDTIKLNQGLEPNFFMSSLAVLGNN